MYMKDGFVHLIEIPYGAPNWNELCANVLEVFGLPGNRYVTSACVDSLSFMFKSEKDKQLCMLLLSEYV